MTNEDERVLPELEFGVLRRYERPVENHEIRSAALAGAVIPYEEASAFLEKSSLTPGSQRLLLGLLRTGTTRVFPGGGVGIEYGSLLKTAVRPDCLRLHVEEVAEHLRQAKVDLLLVPGMSGYPIGAMYSYASGIPAILLKKGKLSPDNEVDGFPAGSFVIPSYTGDGDVVMSSDIEAVRDTLESIVSRQILEQSHSWEIRIVIRCAGADDIIDKATMAQAITESAPLICEDVIRDLIFQYLVSSGDQRDISSEVRVVGWVTPLIKRYNRPHLLLQERFGIAPFAGVEVSSVHLEPCAIGVEGIGVFEFARR